MLIDKIRDHGLKWFIMRIARELQTPTRLWTQGPIDRLVKLKRRFFGPVRRDTRYLRAVYDLEVSPNTYDFACFLVAAEIEATQRGLPGYEIVLLPKYRPDLYEHDYAKVVDDFSQQWRVQALLVPLAHLSDRCKGILVAKDRKIATDYIAGQRVYPELYGSWTLRGIDYVEFYRRSAEAQFEGLSASEHARRAVSRWLAARKISKPQIVITLRGYGHDPARDSSIPDWQRLSRYVAELGFQPIIIPDADVATDDPSGGAFEGLHFLEACWNLDLRMAVYEAAYLNLFVNNGPAQLAALNRRCRYIIFKWATIRSPLATIEYHKGRGMEPGEPFAFALPWQRLVWEEDSFAIMAQHVKAFVDEYPVRGTQQAT
jgi:hypothetical protein